MGHRVVSTRGQVGVEGWDEGYISGGGGVG